MHELRKKYLIPFIFSILWIVFKVSYTPALLVKTVLKNSVCFIKEECMLSFRWDVSDRLGQRECTCSLWRSCDVKGWSSTVTLLQKNKSIHNVQRLLGSYCTSQRSSDVFKWRSVESFWTTHIRLAALWATSI